MKKLGVIAVLVSVGALPLPAVADDFNPQPDPPGKLLLSAQFGFRSIDDPNIRKIAVTGVLRCRVRSGRPSSLVIRLNKARFTGVSTRRVACTLKRPKESRIGGSWSGEIVGACNGKPAAARVFVFDDARGGGDVRLVLTGSAPGCTVKVGKAELLGKLSARMVHDIDN